MNLHDNDHYEPYENPHPDNQNGMQAFELLANFLDGDDWYPRRIDGKYAYSMSYTGKNGDLRCYAVIRVDFEELLFYTLAPIRVPEKVRMAVSEYLTRANYGLRIGNFELDYADGEVRYKSSLNFAEQTLSKELIRNTIYPAVHTVDRYLPGLLRVSFGCATPREAIEEVESSQLDED